MAEGNITMGHKRFPERLAFMLNNPLRRRLSPPENLISKLEIGPEDVMVDFGCGPGYFTVPLARIARKTYGVDISSGMLERMAAYAKKKRVDIGLIQSDGTRIDLPDESVDGILLVHVFHEVESRAKVLGEFLRILRPARRLLIVEKTRGGRMLRKLGPPIINEDEIIDDISKAGFAAIRTVPAGNDSIIIGKKP
ncbi:MAG: methyltransferase domain-containing protein [Candidatus Bathyarchaeia archaeon]